MGDLAGNYGNWCSPAPLYRQLAPKKNANARGIDMTSFDFVTATCGTCHGRRPMGWTGTASDTTPGCATRRQA